MFSQYKMCQMCAKFSAKMEEKDKISIKDKAFSIVQYPRQCSGIIEQLPVHNQQSMLLLQHLFNIQIPVCGQILCCRKIGFFAPVLLLRLLSDS